MERRYCLKVELVEFKHFIKSNRLKKQLSQNDLLMELARYHDSFKRLDITTISRWERGLSKPTKKRQILIARFFDATNFNLTDGRKSQTFTFQESDVSGYADPYSSDSSRIEVVDLKTKQDNVSGKYCALIDIFNENIYGQTKFKTEELINNHSVYYAIIYKSDNSILGHGILFLSKFDNSIKLESFDDMITHLYDDCPAEDADTIFIPTYYSRHYKCENYSFFITYRCILLNKNIKRVIWCVYSRHSLDFCIEQLEARIINLHIAKDKSKRAFKVRGKMVNYALIEIDANNIASYSLNKFNNIQSSINELSDCHYYLN